MPPAAPSTHTFVDMARVCAEAEAALEKATASFETTVERAAEEASMIVQRAAVCGVVSVRVS